MFPCAFNIGMFGKALPYDFDCEYIENAGNNEFVNTGLLVYPDTIAEADFQPYPNQDYFVRPFDQYLTSVSNSRCYFIVYQDGRYLPGLGSSSDYASPAVANPFDRHVVKVNIATHDSYVDGVSVYNRPAATFSMINIPLYLFTRNLGGGNVSDAGKCKMFGFKMWRGNSLVLSARPVSRGGKGFLFDDVRNGLLEQSGDFIAGPRV